MSPAIRISFGIAAMTVCLIFLADTLLGIFPNPVDSALKDRERVCEALGNQFASLAGDIDLEPIRMRRSMESIVSQDEDVLSLGLRSAFDELLASTENHELQWQPADEDLSTPTHVRIPIYQDGAPWATLEVSFTPLPLINLPDLLQSPLYQLVSVMAVVGFVTYLLFLSRTLRYLDPSSVVPGRVRAALDQLVEGAFILDDNQQIVLVNQAFATKVGTSPDAMLGVNPSTLDWFTEVTSELLELPWNTVRKSGERATNVRLQLNSPTLGVRTLTTNVSPIVDGSGKQRGILATFDDISETEKINQHLVETIGQLESTQIEIREKNIELVRLATTDPLTECLNRRAFFEKFELQFGVANREALDISVVMADIDHFKKINDDFGHSVGDSVIIDMAKVLMEFAGVNGFVGRYGGEEFCLVLPKHNASEAAQVANRIRLKFESISSEKDSPTSGRKVTASFGVSTVSFGGKDVAELVNQADEALYESKRCGRNQVSIWCDPNLPQREVG